MYTYTAHQCICATGNMQKYLPGVINSKIHVLSKFLSKCMGKIWVYPQKEFKYLC